MGKFAIMCPECNQYVTAYNGLRGLIHNKITCNCGNVINVKTERMTSVQCAGCGNTVIYDQGKPAPSCPVCKQKILPTSSSRVVSFKCPECGVGLSATEGTGHYTCPVCDSEIDVQREIAKESYSKKGLVSNIKFEGKDNVLIWKHPIEDFNTGSQLIVHESQEAVFFRDGQALDLFGPGRHTLETENLPQMKKYFPFPAGDPHETFHCEVYFVNTANVMGIKWGTDTKVRVFDPVSGLHISLGASGEFNIKVSDARRLLLKVIGTTTGLIATSEDEDNRTFDSQLANLKRYFRSLIMTKVKSYLANVVREQSINILQIDEQLEVISEALRDKINEGLEEYGLTMPEFYVMRFVTPEDDPLDPSHAQYMEMKSLYGQKFIKLQEREVLATDAETKVQMDIIAAQGDAATLKIRRAAEAEAYKMQAEAEAAEMRMKGYNYQQETARMVGTEAMKNGISGGGAGGVGDIAGLGVTLGAMGGVVGMTREAMKPLMEDSAQMGNAMNQGISQNGNLTWNCSCGQQNITGKFCPECGNKRPEPKVKETWDCACGARGLTGKFCPECGSKRPEPEVKETWDCACGARGLTGKFCPECGSKRPEPVTETTWDCTCGAKGLTAKFCPECGKKRGE